MLMIRELFSKLTTRGRVTIPREVRRLLGIAPHDKVVFVVDGDEVRLLRGGVVARTAGALRSSEPPLTAEELRVVAERAIAADVVERTEPR
jgi:antitoxin PrlF